MPMLSGIKLSDEDNKLCEISGFYCSVQKMFRFLGCCVAQAGMQQVTGISGKHVGPSSKVNQNIHNQPPSYTLQQTRRLKTLNLYQLLLNSPASHVPNYQCYKFSGFMVAAHAV
jgi:hypothetical protein